MSIAISRSSIPLIFTGPIPIHLSQLRGLPQRGRDAMMAAGWSRGDGVRYVWPTAIVVWDGSAKRLLIAVDDDTHPDDWAEVLGVLRMAGWLTGRPGYTDIGEPGWDRVSRVWLWDLTCP